MSAPIPTLQEILDLVGELEDAEGARDRFRAYLARSVTNTGALRDYIEACIRTSGNQYNRALQDLVNHAARLIGFTVEFGRYQGVQGQIGFDGLWRVGELTIVAEVKTTDTYAIDTATLLGYVDRLISDKRITDWDHALGLYIIGRPHPALRQLENAIIAEKRVHQLRVATAESILTIADLVQEKFITTDEALALIKPSGATIDAAVDLLARVVSQTPPTSPTQPEASPQLTSDTATPSPEQPQSKPIYLLTPVSDREDATGEQTIRRLLENGWYVFGDSTPGRKDLKPGDKLCFYWSKVGVVATAEVSGAPERKKIPHVSEPEKYPWAFRVKKAQYFFDRPVVIDSDLRARLEAFKGRDPSSSWACLWQSWQP
jgi:hypothetical protein